MRREKCIAPCRPSERLVKGTGIGHSYVVLCEPVYNLQSRLLTGLESLVVGCIDPVKVYRMLNSDR